MNISDNKQKLSYRQKSDIIRYSTSLQKQNSDQNVSYMEQSKNKFPKRLYSKSILHNQHQNQNQNSYNPTKYSHHNMNISGRSEQQSSLKNLRKQRDNLLKIQAEKNNQNFINKNKNMLNSKKNLAIRNIMTERNQQSYNNMYKQQQFQQKHSLQQQRNNANIKQIIMDKCDQQDILEDLLKLNSKSKSFQNHLNTPKIKYNKNIYKNSKSNSQQKQNLISGGKFQQIQKERFQSPTKPRTQNKFNIKNDLSQQQQQRIISKSTPKKDQSFQYKLQQEFLQNNNVSQYTQNSSNHKKQIFENEMNKKLENSLLASKCYINSVKKEYYEEPSLQIDNDRIRNRNPKQGMYRNRSNVESKRDLIGDFVGEKMLLDKTSGVWRRLNWIKNQNFEDSIDKGYYNKNESVASSCRKILLEDELSAWDKMRVKTESALETYQNTQETLMLLQKKQDSKNLI